MKENTRTEIRNEAFTLKDDFSMSGTELKEFESAIKTIEGVTEFIRTTSEKLVFWISKPYKKRGSDEIKNGIVKVSLQTSRAFASDHTKSYPITEVNLDKFDSDLLKETLNTSKMIVAQNRNNYYVSDYAMSTFFQRARIHGEDVGENRSILKIAPAENLVNNFCDITMTIRSFKDEKNHIHKKIFSFLSGRYCPISQDILVHIVREMIINNTTLGTPVVNKWKINHLFTSIHIEFPDAAQAYKMKYHLNDEFVPGLLLMTSDTGDCSLFVRNTYRMKGNNNPVVIDELMHKHSGKISVNELLQEIETVLMPQIPDLPKALYEKMAKLITPENLDLSTTKGCSENRLAVGKAIKRGIRNLGLRKNDFLGKSRAKQLEEQLLLSIDETAVYTEYTLATLFMSLPDRIELIHNTGKGYTSKGLPESTKRKLELSCGRAPFISYCSNEYDEGRLVLLPEDM